MGRAWASALGDGLGPQHALTRMQNNALALQLHQQALDLLHCRIVQLRRGQRLEVDEAVVAGLSKPVEFGDKQIAFVKDTLAKHADVRWTFLFLHEPAWENPSENFKGIQQLLKDRDHTFFAGHLHYYDYDEIDGVEYITMGPAGASWHHDGPGNVDHLTWVTMTESGPQVGNIALKGLFDRRGLDPSLFGAYDRKGPTESTE